MFDLTGRVVVVSGGNAGIGLAFARGVAQAGGDVVVWGRRADRNAEAARELAAFGHRVLAQEVDVSDEARVVAAMAEVVEELGRVDGVIANAGLMRRERSFVEMTSEAWHGLLAVNQHGAFYAVREGARHMKRRYDQGDPGGSLLFCASLSALTGSPGMEHYNAAKGAMVAMSRGIAVEAGRYGIRCNVVCPGYTVSETVQVAQETPLSQRIRRFSPLGRMAESDELAGIGVYFMSDESRFHTGDVVVVDGGWLANAGKTDITELPPWP
ncbi:short-chain dehydrogenase [Frankia sp. CcI49]|uniref:SDR family NAD(P)-dependent oxidoreductase n=1 Tax=unclassified Frankia TaxID=2632575 RepID=UPI0006C9EBA2|nr:MULTISPECIES: SDR family oxidoreductase [unclassified Frankia]KPM54382.1 short-chain dehydrogenase [Frankia sp. R43]ONH58732.1 short-chain dehydrogenase [Frankia sp. CcI49]